MPTRRLRSLASHALLLGLILLSMLSLPAFPSKAASDIPPSAANAIQRTEAAVERGGLNAAQTEEARSELDAARAFETQAEERLSAGRTLLASAGQADAAQRELERQLQADPLASFRAWRAALPADADSERLERLLSSERAELESVRSQAAALRETLSSSQNGSTPDIDSDAELHLQIATLQRRASAASGDEETPPALQQARVVRAQAELRALLAEQSRRQIEQDTAPVRRSHADLQLRRTQRELGEREQRVDVLQALIAERQGKDLEVLLAQLTTQAAEYANADESVRGAAEDTLAMGEELREASEKLNTLRQGALARSQARDAVAAALRSTRARLALDDQDEALGLILVGERRRLPPPDVLAARISAVRADLAHARLQQISLDDLRDRLADIDATIATLTTDETDDAHNAVARGDLHRLYGEQSNLLPRLDTALQRLVVALEQAESTLTTQLSDTRALHALLDRSLLWTRSHGAINSAWLSGLLPGWRALIDPSTLQHSLGLAMRHLLQSPVIPLLALLLAVPLLRIRFNANALTDAVAPPLRKPREDSYLFTWKALGIALGSGLAVALLAWSIGYTLRGTADPQRYANALGSALIAAASSLFLIGVLRTLVVEHGLAHLHFRWLRQRREAIARALPWALSLFVPLQALIVFTFAYAHDGSIDSVGRLLLMVFYALTAWATWRLLDAGANWERRGGSGEPNRIRRGLRGTVTAALLIMVIVVGNGYVYSGKVIADSLLATLWLIAVTLIFHGLLSRWFLLGERRLALNRLDAKREAARQEAETGIREDIEIDSVDPALDLETVNAHTSRLLRALTIALGVGGMLWVWADVLPALARLDDIVLWQVAATAANGTPTTEPVTLNGLLFGLVTLALTVSAARNLPGLLEIGLLNRSRMDAASRYGITTVSRYAIIIIGTLIGLGLLGMRWSQLQWLAAGLTVGLGFGLQEIFANFVSGLIVLSERPFRVGDTVTIGGQTGTVVRISTRATTLRDGDGLELIIPNKAFITERLTNWTLSDTRTRLVVKLGVAYGSDVAQVQALLEKIARSHPLVLAEPAPKAAFVALGASTMDFELRVFVAVLGDREPTLSALHARVVEQCAAQGIELAYPQLDVRVRDLPAVPPTGAAPA